MEVKISLTDMLLNILVESPTQKIRTQAALYQTLQNADLAKFKESLISLFASLPYQNYVKNNIYIYEGFYACVVYSYLASLSIRLQAEETTNRGRLDLSIQIENNIYIIEFKMNEGNPIEQIKANKYHEKFLHTGKDIYLVGIVFDEKTRNISNFQWEKLHN